MTKIQPVNGHLLIEPVKHEEFIASQRESYEEIGVVISFDEALRQQHLFDGEQVMATPKIEEGMRVYFDSWLAAKYPKEGTSDEFYWLVKWEDVRAVEYVEQEISK